MGKKLNQTFVVAAPIEEEKQLIQALSTNLDRKFSKTTSQSLLKARLPFVFDYYYFDLEKKTGIYMELQPNSDKNGLIQITEFPDIPWVVRFRVNADYTVANGNDPQQMRERCEATIRNLDYESMFVSFDD